MFQSAYGVWRLSVVFSGLEDLENSFFGFFLSVHGQSANGITYRIVRKHPLQDSTW